MPGTPKGQYDRLWEEAPRPSLLLPQACTKCNKAYFLKAGRCRACSVTLLGCTECNAAGTACMTCKSGFALKSGKCQACSATLPSCTTCNQAGTVSRCHMSRSTATCFDATYSLSSASVNTRPSAACRHA
ncbi:hypothetical protein ACK3TF_005492 [Chlorella vulgaris]